MMSLFPFIKQFLCRVCRCTEPDKNRLRPGGAAALGPGERGRVTVALLVPCPRPWARGRSRPSLLSSPPVMKCTKARPARKHSGQAAPVVYGDMCSRKGQNYPVCLSVCLSVCLIMGKDLTFVNPFLLGSQGSSDFCFLAEHPVEADIRTLQGPQRAPPAPAKQMDENGYYDLSIQYIYTARLDAPDTRG